MKPGAKLLARQRKSREKLAQAAAHYVNFRMGDGPYAADPIHTVDRAGRPVTVLLRLDIHLRGDCVIALALSTVLGAVVMFGLPALAATDWNQRRVARARRYRRRIS